MAVDGVERLSRQHAYGQRGSEGVTGSDGVFDYDRFAGIIGPLAVGKKQAAVSSRESNTPGARNSAAPIVQFAAARPHASPAFPPARAARHH